MLTENEIAKTWDELVQLQAAQRAMHARWAALEGYGQPMDEALWPIIERFWALGIHTRGSCQGHPSPDEAAWSQTFVTLNITTESESRWQRLVLAMLRGQGVAGVEFLVSSSTIHSEYSSRFGKQLTLEQKWRHALGNWIAALDNAGRECLQYEAPWQPWVSGAAEVPEAVRLDGLLTRAYPQYLHALDDPHHHTVLYRFDGWDWDHIATFTRTNPAVAQQRWEEVWDDWLAHQNGEAAEHE